MQKGDFFFAIIEKLYTIFSVIPRPERCVDHSHVTGPSVPWAFLGTGIFCSLIFIQQIRNGSVTNTCLA